MRTEASRKMTPAATSEIHQGPGHANQNEFPWEAKGHAELPNSQTKNRAAPKMKDDRNRMKRMGPSSSAGRPNQKVLLLSSLIL